MPLKVSGIPTVTFESMRTGGVDAHGMAPVLRPSDGGANPCRHCLQLIAAGEPMLILAYRPFANLQPYAEVGPVFLHAATCVRYCGERFPGWFHRMDPAIVRGYDDRDWIRYETGDVVPGAELADRCDRILAHQQVAYVHVRSKFNCFQCRVERA